VVESPRATRWWRGALLLVGAALFAYLIAEIGLADIASSFRTLSWRLLIVLVFPCLVFKLFDTLGWRFAFPGASVSLLTLMRIRIAGQAVTATTPTGTLGGDAVKAWLLRDRVSTPETLISLIVVKTTMVASQGLFLALGVLVARRILSLDTPLIRGMEWLLVLEAIAVVGFLAVQTVGMVGRGERLLRRVGIRTGERAGAAAEGIDRGLAMFYRTRQGSLVLSIACNLLGWLASAGETWLVLRFLGTPVSVPTALVIEAFGTGVRFATFFVPAQIGVAEGGTVAACVALGLSAATGLSLSLVRRVREAAWTGIGLLLLAGSPRPSRAMVPVSEI
jgi:glycosyltransferase 2 family protein